MTITAATMVQRVRDILGEDNQWLTTGTLANAADTTCDVTDGTDWSEGDYGEFVSDGDQFYVQSVSANILTVLRSVNGTTAAAHAGTALTKNPTYSFIKVSTAVDAVAASLWPWAWTTITEVFNPISGTAAGTWYDLAASAIDLVQVSQLNETYIGSGYYTTTKMGIGTGRYIEFRRDLPSTVASSGIGVRIPTESLATTIANNTVSIEYRIKITPANFLADFSEGNLSECVAWGAAARLAKMQSATRLRDDARQWNQSVTPDDVNQTSDFYHMEYQRLLNNVYDELMRTNPPMRTWTR